ncbi:MAG: hypothetical protein ABW116_13870 [Candidatus Sedimenticola sp. 20ELBAFRAG]
MGINITPPSDDAKLQALNRPASARAADTKPVSELEETERPAAVSQQREHETRHKGERRAGQRRKQQTETYLDTRTQRDRRAAETTSEANDEDSKEEKERSPSTGIDVTV